MWCFLPSWQQPMHGVVSIWFAKLLIVIVFWNCPNWMPISHEIKTFYHTMSQKPEFPIVFIGCKYLTKPVCEISYKMESKHFMMWCLKNCKISIVFKFEANISRNQLVRLLIQLNQLADNHLILWQPKAQVLLAVLLLTLPPLHQFHKSDVKYFNLR